MNVTGISQCIRLSLAAGFALVAVSCSTKVAGDGATVYKVNSFHLNLNNSKPAADPSIPFETEYRLHGAISNVERAARQGNYYTVFWKIRDRSQPVTVRFEYRQKNTGMTTKTVEQQVQPRRKNTTEFAFTGDDYAVNGPITSWRASIVRGGEVLVSYKSYLWE
jgi:hypothetical protein